MNKPRTELGQDLGRFWSKVSPEPTETGCLLWTGSVQSKGYASFGFGAKRGATVLAHRWIYEETVGPIRAGMKLRRICGTRLCMNVEHLEQVDDRRLGRLSPNAQKTHCD